MIKMKCHIAIVLLLLLQLVSRAWLAELEDGAIYLVLMEGKPVAFHQHNATTQQQLQRKAYSKAHAKRLVRSHNQLLQRNLGIGNYSKLYSYTHVANGFAVHCTPSQAIKLKSAKGVSSVEKDRGTKLMTTYTPSYLGLPGPVGTWVREGGQENAGDGIVIALVDTGIEPAHPSFAYDPMNPFHADIPQFSGRACDTGPRFPSGSCNGKIVTARYFAAGAQATFGSNFSMDFMSPYDEVGHGSHVASAAAGNSRVPAIVNDFLYGWASGMAPRARIAVYKAIYPSGGTIADVVAAIDQAARDGADIISLSIGPDEPPEDTITFLSAFDLVLLFAQRAGIFVVQAAGNKGPEASSVVSYSPWAMSVGATTTDRSYANNLILGNGRRIIGKGLSGPTFGGGFIQFPLIMARDAVIVNGSFPLSPAYIEECQHPEALDPQLVQGSVVICSFSTGFLSGTSTLTAIINTAKELGFNGFVFVANPALGDFIAAPVPFSVPGIMIPRLADVQVLLDYYNSQTFRRVGAAAATRFNGRASIAEGRVASFGAQAPTVSRFSSRGPDVIDAQLNPADVLKPDVVAPGDLIWAAWSPMSAADPILSGHKFALLSGTSMATPHVAGIAALIKQSHSSWTPSMIASAISTTASKYDNRGEQIMAEGSNFTQLYPSTPHDHGAGFINPSRALDPGVVFSSGFKDYISFLCSLPSMDPATVKTATGTACNLPLRYKPSDLNLPSITISSLIGAQTIPRTITNVASRPETYLCSVLQPEGVQVNVSPPWFTVAPSNTQCLQINLNVTKPGNGFSFGEIVLTGSMDHIVRIPLSVFPVSAAS